MKYILSLGITFQKHKKPLNVIVSSKQMIDFLTINEEIENFEIKKKENENRWWQWSIPKKTFFYEIDESVIGDRFKIEVDCEDNNYTNGFMSKTSMVQIRNAFIIPKELLKWYFENRDSKRIRKVKQNRFDDPYYINMPRHHNIFDGACWPYQRHTWHWSFEKPEQHTTVDDALLGNNISTQFFDHDPGWIGGKFSVQIDVIKKHGIKMFYPYPDRNKNYGQILTNLFLYEKSLERYYKLNMCNEDQ